MNEELQSSNEELETMNEELRHRTLELNDINAFMDTILTNVGLAVMVVDRNQHIQIWNGRARDLWGLTADEVEDLHLQSLDIGLPLENLKSQLLTTLEGRSQQEEVVLDATNRRGRAFQCRVTLLPLKSDSDGDISGAIMMMEPVGA
jgi:two-component system CheB/CheR fusion protein